MLLLQSLMQGYIYLPQKPGVLPPGLQSTELVKSVLANATQ